jgi:hypothetical protein
LIKKLSEEFGFRATEEKLGSSNFIIVTKDKVPTSTNPFFELQTPTRTLLSPLAAMSTSPPRPPTASPAHQHRTVASSKSQLSAVTAAVPPSLDFYQMKQRERAKHSDYHFYQTNRSKLPAFAHREAVLQLVKSHDIVLISGETGSVAVLSFHDLLTPVSFSSSHPLS